MRGVSLTHPVLAFFNFYIIWGVSLTHPMLAPLFFNLGSFSYTSRIGLIVMSGISLTHPVLASFLSGEFLLHIPCWFDFSVGSFCYTSHAGLLLFFNLGSFSYTSRAGFIFMRVVSLTHPMLA